MTAARLLRERLHNQHVGRSPFDGAADVIRFMGAVQAQDYAAAKWALSIRARGLTERDADDALGRGAILRTHVLRPTWHFVPPADIRWLLTLTAPRVNAANAYFYRQWELDARLFARSQAVLTAALEGGRHLTRNELAAALQRTRVIRAGDSPLRVVGLLMRAELDGLICSGPRLGRQFTYALLEERVPPARPLTRAEARAELAFRYFASHGPATPKDFAWWSGLTLADVRAGLKEVEHRLAPVSIDGQIYWGPGNARPERKGIHTAHLIPAYDESLLSYRDSRVSLTPPVDRARHTFGQIVVIDGRCVATWRRAVGRHSVVVQVTPNGPLRARDRRAIGEAADRYAQFTSVPGRVEFRLG